MDANPPPPPPTPTQPPGAGAGRGPSPSSPPPPSPSPSALPLAGSSQPPSQPPSHPSSQSPSPPHRPQPPSRALSPLSSPGLSRTSPSILHPQSPAPEDPAEDYFQRVVPRPAPQRSRLSTFSISRLPGLGPSDARPPPPSRPEHSRRPSIRIRLSNSSLGRAQPSSPERPASSHGPEAAVPHHGGRSRSASQPSAAISGPVDAISPTRHPARHVPPADASGSRNPRRMVQASLPRLTEEGTRPTMAELGLEPAPRHHRPSIAPSEPAEDDDGDEEKHGHQAGPPPERQNRLRRVSRFFWPGKPRRGSVGVGSVMSAETRHEEEYHEELVDWLDIIDPEVQTLSTLTNVQNSLFIPDLGTWVNRRPTYVLSQHDLPRRPQTRPPTADGRAAEASADAEQNAEAETGQSADGDSPENPYMRRSNTITSRLSDSHYASLPHGQTLDGWTAAEKQELDDRVRHMLHSRRSKFRRTMRGFGKYVRRPLGFFVTLYALLITSFGLAWVLFLIGWVHVGDKQKYTIHVIDSVLVALFAIMGDGLAPFRAIDTYHMIFVLRYSRMIKNAGNPPRLRLQKRRGQPRRGKSKKPAQDHGAAAAEPLPTIVEGSPRPGQVPDVNGTGVFGEAPEAAGAGDHADGRGDDHGAVTDANVEDGGKSDDEIASYHPLNAKQVKSLIHHQTKLANSHSFYKPQETHTHFSFPLNYLVAVVLLLDCHTFLQISLGACTWGIDYRVRPFALTTVILCVSITCNLSAGLVITVGDRKTRKKDVLELLDRQELTGDAIARMEQKKEREEERRREAILERIAAA